jgi:hypothetical protein
MLEVFFDARGLHYEFVWEGCTVNKEMYVEIIYHLRNAVRRKYLEQWSHLLRINAPAYRLFVVKKYLAEHNVVAVSMTEKCLERTTICRHWGSHCKYDETTDGGIKKWLNASKCFICNLWHFLSSPETMNTVSPTSYATSFIQVDVTTSQAVLMLLTPKIL